MGLLDIFRGKSEKRQVSEIFKKIFEFMTNEAVQNRSYPEPFQKLMVEGGVVDEVPGAVGDFGHDRRNPVPVNGPLGELIYISNLTMESGTKVIGHRLGACGRIDVYELLALDGAQWDLLFLDPYYTRKSPRTPLGYTASSPPEKFLLATNVRVPDFPSGIYKAMRSCTSRTIGVPLVAPQLRDESGIQPVSRPRSHIATINNLKFNSRSLETR